jgi:hypothetical protein
LGGKFTPPGNRGSFESEFDQPNRPEQDDSAGPRAHNPGATGF